MFHASFVSDASVCVSKIKRECVSALVMALADGGESSDDSFEVWLWYLKSFGKLDTFARPGKLYVLRFCFHLGTLPAISTCSAKPKCMYHHTL